MSASEDIFQTAASGDAAALSHAPDDLDRPPSRVWNDEGVSLPLYALYGGHGPALDALEPYAEGFTIHEAAALGRIARLEACLAAAPWSVDTLSLDGWTPLHLAAFFAQREAVLTLLDKGADPNLYGRAFERNLPLHASCAGWLKKPEVVELLIPVTVDIDARQGGGWTPLMLAAANDMAESLTLLLQAGADRSLTNDQGQTARDIAATYKREEILRRLDGH